MNCSEVEFLLPLYLSSELDTTRMVDVEGHLQRCDACARELRWAEDCDDLLRNAFLEQPVESHALRERVRKEISKPRRRRSPLRRPAFALPVAAVLIIAIAFGIYLAWPLGNSPTVYAAARNDHFLEVVRDDPRPWRETPQDIQAFVKAELGDADFLDRLAPAGYRLTRALHCILLQKPFVHLVFQRESREISIYVGRQNVDFPGETFEVVNNCALHATSIGQFEVAGFQSKKYAVLVVSDLPPDESLQIARSTARGIS